MFSSPSFLRRLTQGGNLKRALKTAAVVLPFLLMVGCATTQNKELTETQHGSPAFTKISEGLPTEGLWRQEIALHDMNGDGWPDIIAAPPRLAEAGEAGKNRPYIFLWDQKEGKWKEGDYTFQAKGFSYGGIAVGDLNKDGYPDLVLAAHAGPVMVLENDKKGGFVESPFQPKEPFYARTVDIADVNGDGWPDIVSFSEAGFVQGYKSAGILIAINKEGKGWDINTVKESSGIDGDSMAIGDFKGDGHKDVAIAPITGMKELKKLVWFGDGKGNFKNYEGDLVGDMVTTSVAAGDVDGDGKDEIVYRVQQVGSAGKAKLMAFKWTGEGFAEISDGLEAAEKPAVFGLVDAFGDGKKELVVLSEDGLGLYDYVAGKWEKMGFHKLEAAETDGAFDLKAAREPDGTLLIVYNLGYKAPGFNYGLRAYKVSFGGK